MTAKVLAGYAPKFRFRLELPMDLMTVSRTVLGDYPLVNVQKTMDRSTIFDGQTSTIPMAMFNSTLLVYQRGNYMQQSCESRLIC